MKYLWLSSILCPLAVILLAGCHQDPWVSIREGFQTPPDSVRAAVYWYWLDNNISKEGVVKDLEAMKRVGITRAFIGNQATMDEPDGPVKLFSDEWWDITHTAMKTAGELGIEIGMFNCPGWSQSGGPWVTPEQSMKYVEGQLQQVSGNGQEQQLALPEVAEDRIIRVQAWPSVKGASQSWTFRSREGQPFRRTFRLDKNFSVRSLMLQGEGTSWTQMRILADGKQVASFLYDRHNHNPNTGFKPLAPYLIALPDVQAECFELDIEDPADDTFTLTLSELPAVDHYADKSLARMFQDPLPLWDYYMWDTPDESAAPALYVNPASIVDLSGKIKDGKLSWVVPEGEWTVLVSYMESTGVPNSPAVPEGTGLEVDKMSKTHLASHYDAFVGELLRRIPPQDRKTWKVVVEDSYETGSLNWTDDMAEVFRATYGYDPIPFLPVLQGIVVSNQDQSDRFLWDLRRLVADRVAYDYVGGLRELSNRDGMETWLECYGHWGFPGEFLLYGSQSDQIAGEFWSEGSLGDIENRAASSCGHIYGKNRIWAESCTAGGPLFNRYPRLMKQRVDRFFCEGINASLLHLYIQQPDDRVPGRAAWFGNEFNRNNSWFDGMGPFVEYLRRCNFLLQQGRYVADVAYFIGEDAPKMTGVCDPELPKGYSFDYINADVLKNHARVKDGRLVLDSGMEYRVLVLPKQETMRPEMLGSIAKLVHDGLTVLGPAPQRSPSLQEYGKADAMVKELARELWESDLPYYKKGRVYPDGTSLDQVFQDLGTVPDFRYEGEGDLLFIHRTLGRDGDVYFVSNQEDEPVQVRPSFRDAETGSAELWDPLTGAVKGWDGKTLSLEPLQSVFVVFRKDAVSVEETASQTLPLEGPWTVSFAASAGQAGFERSFDRLEDWTLQDDPAVKYYSGSATYRHNVVLPENEGGVTLDLGDVMVLATVKVNGKEAGGVWTWPYRLDISGLVKAGDNTLEVTVYNNWRNRLIRDAALPENCRSTWSNMDDVYDASDDLQASGLLGPVQLILNVSNY